MQIIISIATENVMPLNTPAIIYNIYWVLKRHCFVRSIQKGEKDKQESEGEQASWRKLVRIYPYLSLSLGLLLANGGDSQIMRTGHLPLLLRLVLSIGDLLRQNRPHQQISPSPLNSLSLKFTFLSVRPWQCGGTDPASTACYPVSTNLQAFMLTLLTLFISSVICSNRFCNSQSQFTIKWRNDFYSVDFNIAGTIDRTASEDRR